MHRRRALHGEAASTRLLSTTTLAVAIASAAFVGVTFGAARAEANPLDFAPERLTAPCTPKTRPGGDVPCGGAFIGPAGANVTNYYRPDNAAWAKLVSQYAWAIAPAAMHPARTTGYGGFEFSLFGTISTISKNDEFMRRGTEGAINGGKFPTENGSPDGVLQIYGVQGRKGLPYGFEIQGSAGYMANTEMVILGGGIRLSPFEGFRKGGLGVLPDISVGGYVNTLTGTNKVKMTVPAVDVQVSKPFTVANQVVVQPYLGWQMIWIDVDSGVVDATPKVDGLGNCNARPPTPAEQAAGDSGEFHCQSGGGAAGPLGPPDAKANAAKLDLNNNLVFNNVRFRRQRVFVGLAFRYEVAHLLLHAMTDLSDPASGGDERISGAARQFTFGVATGVSW
ncbi:MAG: hypothetical protein NVS3B10_14560 [Polyangiales bacterium]